MMFEPASNDPLALRGAAPAPAPTTGSEGASQTFVSHYFELLRLSRGTLILFALLGALLSGAFAVYKLSSSPVYVASAKVTVQPSETELEFTRGFVRGVTYDSANVVTQSHMEYLRSREIARRVHETLTAGAVAVAEPEAPSLPSRIKTGLKQTLRWINSGVWPQPGEGNAGAIEDIQEAISLSMIESSFIMRISARWDDPETAARIANILAEVYAERSREQVAEATAEIEALLARERDTVQAEIARLIGEREALRQSFGIVDYETERRDLVSRLAREEARLDDAEADLLANRALLSEFSESVTGQRRTGLLQATEERVQQAQLSTVELESQIAERERIIAELRAEIARMASFEGPLALVEADLERQRSRLADIEQRLLSLRVDLSDRLETLRLIDPATAPPFPAEPQVISSTLSGAVGGVFLALMLIFLRDLRTARARTGADLTFDNGVRVLKPVRRRDLRRSKGPLIDWPALDTPLDVLVLDIRDEDRARRIGDALSARQLDGESLIVGRLSYVTVPGYLPARPGAALITLGRGEIDRPDLAAMVGALRARLRADVPVGLVYVDAPAPRG